MGPLSIAAAVALCALQTASAQSDPITMQDISNRIWSQLVGNQCHPFGNYALDRDMNLPPCIAEQVIALSCERMTQALEPNAPEANRNAYKDCLLNEPSTFLRDQRNCLLCKGLTKTHSPEQNEYYRTAFRKATEKFSASTPTGSLWSMTEIDKDSNAYRELPVTKPIKVSNETMAEFFRDLAGPSKLGSFRLEGAQQIGASAETKNGTSKTVKGPMQCQDPVGQEIEVIMPTGGRPTTGAGNDTRATEVKVMHVSQWNYFSFTSSTNFTYAYSWQPPVRVAGIRGRPATQEDVKTLPNGAGCGSCEKLISPEQISKAAAATVEDASELGISLLDKTAQVSGGVEGQISEAVQEKIEVAVYQEQKRNVTVSTNPPARDAQGGIRFKTPDSTRVRGQRPGNAVPNSCSQN
ncbi:hypothetical protein RJ55_01757 [Drechmeria coniospora]|nr:hypothetical protein RJ55_01757 [Drechmeria coniospora]